MVRTFADVVKLFIENIWNHIKLQGRSKTEYSGGGKQLKFNKVGAKFQNT